MQIYHLSNALDILLNAYPFNVTNKGSKGENINSAADNQCAAGETMVRADISDGENGDWKQLNTYCRPINTLPEDGIHLVRVVGSELLQFNKEPTTASYGTMVVTKALYNCKTAASESNLMPVGAYCYDEVSLCRNSAGTKKYIQSDSTIIGDPVDNVNIITTRHTHQGIAFWVANLTGDTYFPPIQPIAGSTVLSASNTVCVKNRLLLGMTATCDPASESATTIDSSVASSYPVCPFTDSGFRIFSSASEVGESLYNLIMPKSNASMVIATRPGFGHYFSEGKMKRLMKNNGFSLAEVMIASLVLAGASLVGLQVMESTTKGQKK